MLDSPLPGGGRLIQRDSPSPTPWRLPPGAFSDQSRNSFVSFSDGCRRVRLAIRQFNKGAVSWPPQIGAGAAEISAEGTGQSSSA